MVSLNTLTVDNVNDAADWVTDPPPAHFENNRVAIVSGMEYAANGTNYKTYITQSASTYTIPSGPNTGLVMILTTNFTQWNIYESGFALEFDSVGIITSTGTTIEATPGGLWRLVGPNFYSLADSNTYDIDGNIVGSAP